LLHYVANRRDECNDLKMTFITIHRIANGKLVEKWAEKDVLGFLQQIRCDAPDEAGPGLITTAAAPLRRATYGETGEVKDRKGGIAAIAKEKGPCRIRTGD
jgi:hypothetical protein